LDILLTGKELGNMDEAERRLSFFEIEKERVNLVLYQDKAIDP